MNALLRRLVVPIVILIALSAGGVAMCGLPGDSLDDGSGIVGTYVVNGVDPSGVEYSGTVTIAEADVGYAIQWIVTGAVQVGEGRLIGDVFEVVWSSVTDPRGDVSGNARYTVGPDGTLVGERTTDGVVGVGTEEIFPEP